MSREHYGNVEDVSEFARHHDWPIRNGSTLQNHLKNVLEVFFNEKETFQCESRCKITLLVKKTQTDFAFEAIVKQLNPATKQERTLKIEGFMNVYARIELMDSATEGQFYLPKMFTRIEGEDSLLIELDAE